MVIGDTYNINVIALLPENLLVKSKRLPSLKTG